jgi:MFS family permease
MSHPSRTRTIAAMLAAAFAFGAGLSLGLPLLSLVLEGRGVAASWIGLNTAMAAVAAFLVMPLVTPVTRRFGAAPVLVTALVVTALGFVGFYAAGAFWMWFPLRLVFHGGLGFVFVLTEFWINALAPPARRGLVMGLYATFLAAGFMVGPLMLAWLGSGGAMPFVAGAAVILASIGPVLLAAGRQPDLSEDSGHAVTAFLVAVPAATFAAFVFGAAEAGGMAILPLYGLALGFPERDAALLVSAVAGGNILLQIPIGLMADRGDKIKLLLGCGVCGVAGAAAAPFVAASFWPLAGVLFLWGGITAGLYTVGIAALGQRYQSGDLAMANASFASMYAAGMLVGPPALGFGLERLPPHGPMLALAVFFAAYVAVAWIWRRRGAAVEGGVGGDAA